jgi:hypothetical protein
VATGEKNGVGQKNAAKKTMIKITPHKRKLKDFKKDSSAYARSKEGRQNFHQVSSWKGAYPP